MEKQKPVLPGPYPIKIVTHNQDGIKQAALDLVENHFPEYDKDKTKHKHSEGSQYVSTTVILYVETEEQLKKLHLDLKALSGVILVL
jgi:uncharacterized protein